MFDQKQIKMKTKRIVEVNKAKFRVNWELQTKIRMKTSENK